MEFQEPLPLIEKPEYLEDESTLSDVELKRIGYVVLLGTWLVFIITMNTLFKIWEYIIYPLSLSAPEQYKRWRIVFETGDRYIMGIWSLYVVMWLWAYISWCGLKLFRHSKGIQLEEK